jgi:translation initiation factor IF-3
LPDEANEDIFSLKGTSVENHGRKSTRNLFTTGGPIKRRYHKRRSQPFYQINQYIRATQVRLIDAQGKQIGVMPITQARQLSRQQGLDLVEVAPKAQPPVVKIIDFKKFKFQESKKQQEQQKKTKKGDLKEIRLTPFMAEGDYQVRLKRIHEFLKNGHRIRISVFYKGRQMANRQAGYDLINKLVSDLSGLAKPDQPPKFIGRKLIAYIVPDKQPAKKSQPSTNTSKPTRNSPTEAPTTNQTQ